MENSRIDFLYISSLPVYFVFLGEIISDDEDDEDDSRNEADKRRKKKKPVGFLDQDDGPKPIDQALLKKYLAYSRTMCKPVLQAVDSEKVTMQSF